MHTHTHTHTHTRTHTHTHTHMHTQTRAHTHTHTHTHTRTHTCTHTWTHNIYMCAYNVSSIAYKLTAFPYSCVIYDGSLCSSVFGQANITAPSSITSSALIAYRDIRIGGVIEEHSAVLDQDCLNYALFLGCLAAYPSCLGSAWCGANSRDELRSAVISACSCNRADSCVVNVNGFNITAENALIAAINASLLNYYVGSSSTGPVGDSNAMCQDVTGKRHNLHACSLHCVVHGVAGGSILYLCGGVSDVFIDFTQRDTCIVG